MEYGRTAYNRTVYAAPAVAGLAYAGTLCAMLTNMRNQKRIYSYQNVSKINFVVSYHFRIFAYQNVS
jgi:hypothetical protein